MRLFRDSIRLFCPIVIQDLKIICHVLITKVEVKERLQMMLQIFCLGRVDEISQLGWQSLSWVNTPLMKCIEVNLSRSKNKQVTNLFLFPHRTCYRVSVA